MVTRKPSTQDQAPQAVLDTERMPAALAREPWCVAPPGEVEQVVRFASSGFAPHGAMQVQREGAVIRCEARGPFNAEFMRAYARMWAAHRDDWVAQGPLVIHTVWTGSMLTSPDGLKVFRQLMERAARLLPARTLHLWTAAPEIEGRSLMLPFWHGVMREFSLSSQDCASEAEACAAIEAFLKQA